MRHRIPMAMKNRIYIIDLGNKYELRFGNNSLLIYLIKKIPTAVFSVKRGCWYIDKKENLKVKEFCSYAKQRFLVGDVVNLSEPSEIVEMADEMPDLHYKHKLLLEPYPYQRRGIQYMITHKRCFNCDDMGLGKTFETIAAVDIADAYPALIVCPASMKITWQREFKRFTGKEACILNEKNKNTWQYYIQTGTCKVFITNYESVKKFFIKGCRTVKTTVKGLVVDGRMRYIKSVVIDECHRTKEPSCLWSKYLEAMCHGKEYVYMLTGTPVVIGNKDLIQQLKIMGRIDDFGGARNFRERYCSKEVSDERLSELNYRLWETCFFRRDKRLVLKDLPEKIRQYNVLEIDNREEYIRAEEDLISYLKKYRDANDEKIKKSIRGYVIVQMNVLREITAEGKMYDAVKSIHDIIDGGEKLIVFVAHKIIVQKLKKEFRQLVKVTGDDNAEVKQKAIDKFQNDPDCKLIVVNIQSGGVGITLTAASNVLFIEFPWTAADCDQCECRSHRNGQKKVVVCTYLLGKDTVDEKMYDIIQKERYNAGIVTGAKDNTEEKIINTAMDIYKDRLV